MAIRKKDGIYTEDEHKMNPPFLSEQEYARATEALILVTVDVMILDREAKLVYLTKRRVQPWPYFWYIGGRRKPGETPVESARRNFQRETTLELPADRLELLTVNENIWKERKESPKNVGKHDVSYIFGVELSSSELKMVSANLDKEEYEGGLEAFSRERLKKEDIHLSIRDLYDRLFPDD